MDDVPDLSAGCAMTRMLKILARAWVSDIVQALGQAPALRFGALRRQLPGDVSARVLSVRLKELEALGLVVRVDAGTMPMQVDYSLTPAGRRLDTVLQQSETASAQLGLLTIFDQQPDIGR